MKAAKSIKSVRSLKSVGSLRQENFSNDFGQIVFEECLPTTCNKFNCPYTVLCTKQYQRDDFHKSLKVAEATTKYKQISIAPPLMSHDKKKVDDTVAGSASTGAATVAGTVDPDTVLVCALYDALNRLAEVTMYKVKHIPRILMQVLGILLPHFDQLTKLTIRKCGINVYTIHDLNKMLHVTTLSEICLDESPLPEGNYAILLERQSGMKNLSLCRCRINDEVCKQIARKLRYSEPAEKNLLLLNLSSNHITDVGAKYLGEALRTNRHLRYLNLADNRIHDEGAGYILDSLTEFPLTYDEMIDKRKNYMKYLKTRVSLFLKYLRACENQSHEELSTLGRKAPAKKGSTLTSAKSRLNNAKNPTETTATGELLRTKADAMVQEMLGPFYHPFGPRSVATSNGWPYCTGNMVLCYLNLAYNDLAYPCLKKLIEVLVYQANLKKPTETGLMRVVLDGNNLPQNCFELVTIGNLINKSVARFGGRPEYGLRRKSRNTVINTVPLTKRAAKS